MTAVQISWTDKMITKEVNQYQTRGAFKKGSPAYNAARKREILDKVCKHMK